MEPEAKKAKSDCPVSSTPKKCPLENESPKKRKVSCPIVLPFLPPPNISKAKFALYSL